MHVSFLEQAIAIAVEAHKGQVDKAGQPYILHPLRVMHRLAGEAAMAAGVLHDVVEDAGWTPEGLRQAGMPDEVAEAVARLSRAEGETYEAFIARVAGHGLARRVKLADLADNMDMSRLAEVTQRDLDRLAKYHRAWLALTG